METREQIEFQSLFKRTFPQVKNFALMLLKSEAEAEDVAQDIFCHLWQRPELWLGKGESLDKYLFVMAKNAVLNIFKHQTVQTNFETYAKNRTAFSELIGNDPMEDIYYEEKVMLMELALNKMPDKRRTIFMMSRMEELSNREIALRMNLSVRTVEHQIYLALKDLKKVLAILFPLVFFN